MVRDEPRFGQGILDYIGKVSQRRYFSDVVRDEPRFGQGIFDFLGMLSYGLLTFQVMYF